MTASTPGEPRTEHANGRLVVVTGGGGGVGRAVALRFAAGGDVVVIVGRDRAALTATAAAARGCTVEPEECDVTDEDRVSGLFERLGAVDVLVNNAGIATSASLRRTPLSDWRDQLEVNATGAFLCTRAALPGMTDRDRGRIITVASTAGLVGSPYTAAYTASKHAAVGLMRAVAAEVAGSGVTANAVCPTFIDTDMTRRSAERIAQATARTAPEAMAALVAASPLGRLLTADEVAASVAFLASEDAAAINGQTIVLDGGGVQA